jgi:hypothetical protein
MSTVGGAADVNPVIKFPPHTLLTGLTSAASARVDISSTCKVGQKLGVSLPPLTMLPLGVTIPATVPKRSEIPERLMNYPVYHSLASCIFPLVALQSENL